MEGARVALARTAGKAPCELWLHEYVPGKRSLLALRGDFGVTNWSVADEDLVFGEARPT